MWKHCFQNFMFFFFLFDKNLFVWKFVAIYIYIYSGLWSFSTYFTKLIFALRSLLIRQAHYCLSGVSFLLFSFLSTDIFCI